METQGYNTSMTIRHIQGGTRGRSKTQRHYDSH